MCGSEASCLLSDPGMPGVPSHATVGKALHNINLYWVGLTEYFELSLELFARKMPRFFGILSDAEKVEFPVRRQWITRVKRKFMNQQSKTTGPDDIKRILEEKLIEPLAAVQTLLSREGTLYEAAKSKFFGDLEACGIELPD